MSDSLNNKQSYLYTDWQALTSHDWAGLLLTVVIFLLMCFAYFQVFRPKNKTRLESYSAMALDDEITHSGDNNE